MARCKEKRTRKTKYANLISFPFFWDTFVQFSAEWEPAPPVCCRWSYWARTRERREQSEWGWSGATLHIPGKNKPIDMIKNHSTESVKSTQSVIRLKLDWYRVNSLIDEKQKEKVSLTVTKAWFCLQFAQTKRNLCSCGASGTSGTDCSTLLPNTDSLSNI